MLRPALAFFVLLLAPLPAFAHSGAGPAGGLIAGFGHPFGGLDHLLAMVAVGAWAAQLGGRAVWALPIAFPLAMLAGAALALAGLDLPLVETGIAASVALLGLAVAIAARVPAALGAALVAAAALLHGHAHGAELPADAAPAAYAVGMLVGTALLHAAGVGLGRAARQGWRATALRGLGAAVAAAGCALVVA